MNRFGWWMRGSVLLLVVVSAAAAWGGGMPLGYVKTITLQNLAPNPSKFYGHYLAMNEAGDIAMSNVSSKTENSSHWELKFHFGKERGYLTHTIAQRGDNPNNGKYLCIDEKTGKLTLSDTDIPTARWLIRYAGKYPTEKGYDAFQIQNLAQGATGMSFLALDEATGEVFLSPKLVPGAYWFMSDTPYLPAETSTP